MPPKRMSANSKGLLESAGISRSLALKVDCDEFDVEIIDQANAWPKLTTE